MEAMKVDKVTVCGGGNGAQTLVPIAACNLGCAVDLYAPLAMTTSGCVQHCHAWRPGGDSPRGVVDSPRE